VPVAALIALVGVVALTSDRGTGGADPQGAIPDNPSLRSPAPPSVGSTPAPEPADPASPGAHASADPSAVVQEMALGTPRADLSALPELGATHLAVQAGKELGFLDLRAGLWTGIELSSPVYTTVPVGEGLVVSFPGSGVGYASAGGGGLTRISQPLDGGFVGVSRDLVLLNVGPSKILARNLDGSIAHTVDLPAGGRAQAVTADGEIVVNVEDQIVLVDPATGDTSDVATGRVAGVVGPQILVGRCDEDLRCGVEQINSRTGERWPVADELGSFGPTRGESIVFTSEHGAVTVFHLAEGILTPVGEGQAFGDPGFSSTIDTWSGVSVQAVDDAIVFSKPTGERIAAIAAPFSLDSDPSAVLDLVGATS
jgi:hypothetical protein